MKKIIYLIILLIPLNVFALNYPELHYENAIIYDLTDDTTIYSYNSDEKSSIASLTKIMTTITAIEEIDNLEDYVTYTSEMASLVRWDLSVAGLKVGNQVTYKDLLYASILPSGADATTALAISTSGSIESFVEKMNTKAQEIGMTSSHFVNVTGLDEEGHYSSAKDIALLLKYALKNENFKEIYTTKTYTLSNNLFVKSTIYTYRGNTERIIGSKTGFTLDAGRCISIYFNSNNHDMILVTLKAPNDKNTYHIKDALELIDFIDENYHDQELIKEQDIIKELPIKYSKKDSYEVRAPSTISKYLPDDYDKEKFIVEYEGKEELKFSDKEGTEIGELNYYYNNELIHSDKVILNEKLSLSIPKLLSAHKYLIIIAILLIIAFIIMKLRVKKRLKKKSKKRK